MPATEPCYTDIPRDPRQGPPTPIVIQAPQTPRRWPRFGVQDQGYGLRGSQVWAALVRFVCYCRPGDFLTEGMRDSPLADDELLHCSLQARAVFRSLGLMLLLQDFRVMVYRAYTFWGWVKVRDRVAVRVRLPGSA